MNNQIMFILQDVGKERAIDIGVVSHDYNFGVWVDRWFSVTPVAIEISENVYKVVFVLPTFVSLSEISILSQDMIATYIEDLPHKIRVDVMVDDSVLGNLR